MITFNGPASAGWKPFGALGQTPAIVTPTGETPPKTSGESSALPDIAKAVAFLVAGGALVYLVMTFSDSSEQHREFPR